MPASARFVRRAAAWLAVCAGIASCSLAFAPDELSSRAAQGGEAGHGGRSNAGGAGGERLCDRDDDCDDHNPCTEDVCSPDGCLHTPTPNAACGEGTECTPNAQCTAEGECAPGQPDDTKCDDHNECTIDTCDSQGCTHAPRTGAVCSDGDPCHAAGTCNGTGHCAAAAIPPTEVCIGDGPCPGGFYISDFHCNPFCGQCPLCVNAV